MATNNNQNKLGKALWAVANELRGAMMADLMHYFNDAEDAYAIKFKNIHQLSTPMDITMIEDIKSAPQSYQYVHESIADLCEKLDIKIR